MIGPELGTKTTLETYLDHIDYAVKIAGIDHVGVAADFLFKVWKLLELQEKIGMYLD